jgi:hypothetical protein
VAVGFTVATAPVFHPALTVTPNSGLTDGATITVTGSGYDTTTPNTQGTGNAGAYVELGWIQAAGWQPSTGAPSSTRSYATAIWVHSSAVAGSPGEGVLNADGSFSVTLTINAALLATKQLTGGTLAVFTVAPGGSTNVNAEAFAPITLATVAPPVSGEQQTITATVPAAAGEFSWTIDATNHAVTLTNAVNKGSYLESTGSLLPVTVSDTRLAGPAWSISGQVGGFSGGLSGKYLGWTPAVTTAGAGATAGSAVTPGITSGNGLTDASTLGSAVAGHATGSASLGAGLTLQVPVDTAAGTYTATLTLTALS